MIEIIKGSLLDATEKYIAHQTNATTNQAGGLAYHLFNKFPHANTYIERPQPFNPKGGVDFPGNIQVRGDGKEKRYVINMIGQYYPGKPLYDNSVLDGTIIRKGYFRMCLTKISVIKGLESIAFPVVIGCGLAKGSWKEYLAMLDYFATSMMHKDNTRVVLYDNTQSP